jgi:hypothetical protein
VTLFFDMLISHLQQDLDAAQKSIQEREEREQAQREEALRLLASPTPPPMSASPAPQTAAPAVRISFVDDSSAGRKSPRRGPALRLSGVRREEESTPQRIQHMRTDRKGPSYLV